MSIESITDQQADAAARRKRGSRPAPTIDRLPPHSIEMEQGVLGCILLDPPFCLDILTNKWATCGKLAFYDLRHQHIYECLVTMHTNGEPIDFITVHQWLKDRDLLDKIGGIAYLSQTQDAVPSAANLEYYADQVFDKYILRCYIQTCTGVVGRIYDFEGDVDALADQVERDILAIHRSQNSEVSLPTSAQLVNDAIGALEEAMQNNGQPMGLPTGLADVDRRMDGLRAGEMTVIAARPSVGKTALAMNFAEHVALNLGLPVGIFSLEMTSKQLITRMLASVARVNIRAIVRDQMMQQQDTPRLTNAAGRIGHAPLWIDDTPDLTIMQIRARARRMVKDHGIKLIIVDYLQLVKSSRNKSSDSREQEVADVSSGLKAMAKELNLPVIAVSQLNRELEKTARKPRMSDLRESGSLEQDANNVVLLYRDNDSEQTSDDSGYTVVFYVAKQRDGERDFPIRLTYLPFYTRFENQAPQHGIPEPTYAPELPYQDN